MRKLIIAGVLMIFFTSCFGPPRRPRKPPAPPAPEAFQEQVSSATGPVYMLKN